MTNLRYSRSDCAEESQVRGIAPSSNAWNVNLHNGNANINNQNNSGGVLACRRAARKHMAIERSTGSAPTAASGSREVSRAMAERKKDRDAHSSLSAPMQALIRALARQTVAEQRDQQRGIARSGNAQQKKRAA